MKSVFFVLAMSVSLSAQALESFYGELSYVQGQFLRTYKNDGAAKDFKYVVFTLEPRTGNDAGAGLNFDIRIDQKVAAFETIVAPSGINMLYKGQYCRFLAR